MTVANDELPRWRETSPDPSASSGRAADLVDAAREVPPLPPRTLARIEAEVIARRPSRGAWGMPFGLRFALLAVVLLASAATAKGMVMLWQRHVAAEAASPTKVRHGVSSPSRPRAPVISPAPAPTAEETPDDTTDAPLPAPPARGPSPRTSATHARRVAMAKPTPSPEPPAVETSATEAQLLAGALSRLRQAHDPAGALALLDAYARKFPDGVLQSEALSTRIEAVLRMDDRKTALRLLDGRATFAGRPGAALLLTRAELRASAGRYADALGDFERVLAPQGSSPADQDRALYGRAVSLGHLGQDARARADLIAYQQRFPDGKHAAEVARLLGKRP
ncbi:MAG TPA: hypothetical protein VGP07_20760 [Polyangia bacterium]|jgi:hypothetical protein